MGDIMSSNKMTTDKLKGHNQDIEHENYDKEDREHGRYEMVGDKDCNGWTIEWWKWLLGKSNEESPFMVIGHAGPDRYIAGQPTEMQQGTMKEHGESVWFLCASPYSGDRMVRLDIPLGNWSILATPYVCTASTENYPSLKTTAQLSKLVHDDVAGIYDLWAKLDGTSLNFQVVDMTDEQIEIDGIASKNMLGIDNKTLMQKKNIIRMVQFGYWIWLKPLTPGDHLLHLHGYSRNYELDMKFQLSVTGPE
jgi:hypothetical protein